MQRMVGWDWQQYEVNYRPVFWPCRAETGAGHEGRDGPGQDARPASPSPPSLVSLTTRLLVTRCDLLRAGPALPAPLQADLARAAVEAPRFAALLALLESWPGPTFSLPRPPAPPPASDPAEDLDVTDRSEVEVIYNVDRETPDKTVDYKFGQHC